MAKIALIQTLFPILHSNSGNIAGFSRQLRDKFFEVLVDESGHHLQQAATLDDYQTADFPIPDIVICAPFPESGNVAPGFVELQRIRATFPDTIPLVVWSTRNEEFIQKSCLEDYGAADYYTGTLLQAPGDIADIVLKFIR